MKKIIAICLTIILSSFVSLFAFTEEQLELAHNPEFALSQRLQLDTVIARKNSGNRMVLSELALRDLVPTMNAETKGKYISFNQSVASLELLDIQRERLNYLHDERKKSNLIALVPNALSVASIAITTGFTNPIGAIISIAGAAVSSAANYLEASNQENLEFIQSKWELDDQEREVLLNLGTMHYEYKCNIALDLGLPIEMTLSTRDLEDFVDYCNIPAPQFRLIRLLSMDRRLEILPDYWMELALASYGLMDYAQTLEYISKFEEIYCPVIYHDADYAYLLMVKADCVNQVYGDNKYATLEEIGDRLLDNIETSDWEKRFFVLSLYMEIYRNTSDQEIAEKAYNLFPVILYELIANYNQDVKSYLSGEYSQQGLNQIQTDIDSAEVEVTNAATNISTYEELQIKNGKKEKDYESDAAYQILLNKLSAAESKLETLKENYAEFERTSALMIPPSSDFLCSIMKEYINMTELFGQTESTVFKSTCDYFFEAISQNVRNWNDFSDYNFKAVPEPYTDVVYRFEVRNRFIFFGGEKIAIFEIPVSLINPSATGSESIIDEESVSAFIQIDNVFTFPLTIRSLDFELGGRLDESFLNLSFEIPSKFEIQMAEPVDSESQTNIEVNIFSSYFNPIEIVLDESSELYDECVEGIEYVEE